jgi:hypothetical protein
MKRRLLAGFVVSALALPLWMGPLRAQTPDPAFTAAKARFEALDIEARRAIQRDLVWVAGFTGAAGGEFGALTFAALRRFETGAGSKVDGMLEPAERAALAKAAGAARAAQGFVIIEAEKGGGMRIGVPTKLLAKRSKNAAGLERWQDGADKVTLDLHIGKPEDTLPALFEKGVDPKVSGRKITYKLIRPEFFVISGETAGGKFYRRMEAGPGGALRGFSIGYDKAVAPGVDPLVIAIASTFEGFPSSRATPQPPVASQPGASLTPPVSAPKRKRISGIVVAEGRIVTSEAAAKACKSLALDGPARMMASVEKTDPALGLALVTTATARAKPVTLASPLPKEGVLMQRDLDGKLLAAPASVEGTTLFAPVQEGGAGAGLFDAECRLAAVVTGDVQVKYAVAGTLPVLRYTLVSATEVARFAGLSGPAAGSGAARSAGEIAEMAGSGVVSLFCGE